MTTTNQTKRFGTDLDIFGHCLDHVRACYPVSCGALKGWMQWQLPGVDSGNVDRIAREFIHYAVERRLVTCDRGGYLDLPR